MSRVVPLIRAAALMPILRWLRENGRSVEEVLSAAGQSHFLAAGPMTPIPILGAVSILSLLERREGADIGVRMATEASVLEMAVVSRGVLGAGTPREAFARVVMAMPSHCTHEVFSMASREDGVMVRDSLAVPMDTRTRHVVDQYVLGIVHEICAMTGAPGPIFSRVEMTPHPERGLAHLSQWFGDVIVPSQTQTRSAWIRSEVADRPFRKVARNRFTATDMAASAPLRGDGSLAQSVRLLLPLMLHDDSPTLDRLVTLSGMSRRTLQRRLSEEGTSFSDLFAEMRQHEAMLRLARGNPIAEISRQLGFSQQSALTRAVRRWTGDVPSRLRARSPV